MPGQRASAYVEGCHCRDLARNEEFSEIAVINIFFTVLQKNPQLSVGGPAGKISR